MASEMGDVMTDSSPFHMMGGSGLQHQHPRDAHSHYQRHRSVSWSQDQDVPSYLAHPAAAPRGQGLAATTSARHTSREFDVAPKLSDKGTDKTSRRPQREQARQQHQASGASRFPSPFSDSSPPNHVPSSSSTITATADPILTMTSAVPSNAMPSPDSDTDERRRVDKVSAVHGSQPRLCEQRVPVQKTILIRDVMHIKSLAAVDEMLSGPRAQARDVLAFKKTKYEISRMPIGDVIDMVAALLEKMAKSNDAIRGFQNAALVSYRKAALSSNNAAEPGAMDKNQLNPLSCSVLAFHGKNIPAIPIHSYLSRIHKYCPTTYEVFLSLLVYFDRMSQRVKALVEGRQTAASLISSVTADSDEAMDDGNRDDDDQLMDSGLADDSGDEGGVATAQPPARVAVAIAPPGTFFCVDSFNIHRLIITGVTCASKFFSDVFYTNSRYAKVGGLPLGELNHLELQFLILNDFRLAVPVEDLEAYATMLVEYYARDVLSKTTRQEMRYCEANGVWT